MQKRKSSLKVKAAMVWASAAIMGFAVFKHAIPNYKNKMKEIERQKIEWKNKSLEEKKQEIERRQKIKDRQKELIQIEKSRARGKEPFIDIKKLNSNYSFLTALRGKNISEVKSYLERNVNWLSKNYKPLTSAQAKANRELLEPVVRHFAKKYNVSDEVMLKLFQNESGWDPFAIGKSKDIGLGQLTPIIWNSKTHKEFNCNPFDPVRNIEVATKYYSDLFKKFKNHKLALTAYNDGETIVTNKLNLGMSIDRVVSTNKHEYALRVLRQKL